MWRKHPNDFIIANEIENTQVGSSWVEKNKKTVKIGDKLSQ